MDATYSADVLDAKDIKQIKLRLIKAYTKNVQTNRNSVQNRANSFQGSNLADLDATLNA